MFDTRQITSSTLRAAFAIRQLAAPDAALAEFRKQVLSGRLHGAKGAIVGVFDRRAYVHALFRARMDMKAGQCARLRITDVMHVDSISTAVTLEMIEAIERWARQAGCSAISIEAEGHVPNHGIPLADVLVSRGFCGQTRVFARRI